MLCTKGIGINIQNLYPLDLTHTKNMSLFPYEKEINKPYLSAPLKKKDIYLSGIEIVTYIFGAIAKVRVS